MSAQPLGPWPRPFGRYTLLAPLAQGGMGDVCIALAGTVTGAERLCVVKTIRADLAGDKEFLDRFLDEGRVVCALSHPNVAQVMEVGTEAGVPFLAMEFVAGEDLDRVTEAAQRAGAALSLDFVLTVVAGVLDGLSYAHGARALDGRRLQIVHRDISPQNVRVGWDGDVKVLDFGAARAVVRETQTMHGVVFGKPGYMSPEQARGEPLDARADLYALGVVTWELLAGAELARRETAVHMQQVALGKIVLAPLHGTRGDVPPALDAWIARMTCFEAFDRFDDAPSARRALVEIARAQGGRLERDAIVETLGAVLHEERESSRSYVTSLVARGRAVRVENTSAEAPLPVRRTAPTQSDEVGVIAGTRYRVGELLGSGGMGEVFAAEQVDLGRRVALKLLYPEHSYNPSIAQRFRMEARAIASLSHPNLVEVTDFGETADGRLFYAMERLEGQTLRARIDAATRLDAGEAVRIGAAVARGLSAAHDAGVIHRDLKPENVFLVHGDVVKLLDFGVAKTTGSSALGGKYTARSLAGEVFGSPGYISPEQGTGKPVDVRTDIYSLGAVLYEALTGTRVFDGGTMVEVLAKHLGEAPTPIAKRAPGVQVPEALELLVLQCLAKDPASRPQSAREVADELDAIGAQIALGGASRVSTIHAPGAPPPASDAPAVVTREEPEAPSAPPLVRPSGRARALVVGVVLAALGCAGLVFWSAHAHPPAAPTSGPIARAGRDDIAHAGAVTAALPTTTRVADAAVAPTPRAVGSTVAADVGHRADGSRPRVVHGVGNAHVAPLPTPTPDPRANEHAIVVPTVAAVPPTPRPAPTLSHYELAQAALEARQYDRAVTEANASILAHERIDDARVLVGQAYMREGRRDAAVAQWRIVLARDAANPRARQLLRAADENPDPP